jgi:hypothetical protein
MKGVGVSGSTRTVYASSPSASSPSSNSFQYRGSSLPWYDEDERRRDLDLRLRLDLAGGGKVISWIDVADDCTCALENPLLDGISADAVDVEGRVMLKLSPGAVRDDRRRVPLAVSCGIFLMSRSRIEICALLVLCFPSFGRPYPIRLRHIRVAERRYGVHLQREAWHSFDLRELVCDASLRL